MNIGCYNTPFKKDSQSDIFMRDNSKTFNDYISIEENWFSETSYKYTLTEMQNYFKVIEQQRIWFKAALLVVEGKFISINPALRHLGIKI